MSKKTEKMYLVRTMDSIADLTVVGKPIKFTTENIEKIVQAHITPDEEFNPRDVGLCCVGRPSSEYHNLLVELSGEVYKSVYKTERLCSKSKDQSKVNAYKAAKLFVRESRRLGLGNF